MSNSGARTTSAVLKETLDRPIALIDATCPPELGQDGESRGNSRSPPSRQLAKRSTKHSAREGLARWKYSRWQQDCYAAASTSDAPNSDDADGPTMSGTARSQLLQPAEVVHAESGTSNFALKQKLGERGRKRLNMAQVGAAKTNAEKKQYEIDVLYENQRGWFFFGIPLYSHSSLLNFDPSPWMTKDGKDSAVNITNAQLPDPSWEWAWKSWYVDMSYDVDEEGWQYSFSFSRNFSWHGSHPWFHCFVRRRRWLRGRAKKQEMKSGDISDMRAAHKLTSDYFTIHSKRGRSPASATEKTNTLASTHISRRNAEDVHLPPEDIKDIPSLFAALRLATIDREKTDAVKRFVETGGDELVYLEEHIPEIMGFFVFQASRRQLLEFLMITTREACARPPTNKDDEQRSNDLRNAVRAADKEIGALEYWSDRQQVLERADGNGQGRGSMLSEPSPMPAPNNNNPVGIVKGIAGEAEVGIDRTKRIMSTSTDSTESPRYISEEKGQGKLGGTRNDEAEGSEQDSSSRAEPPTSLPGDSVKVRDRSTEHS